MSNEFNGLELGARESAPSNRIYLDLRAGRIGQTSDKQLPGFVPASSENAAGEVFHFFAKTLQDLTGYIDDLYFRSFTTKTGTVINSWNVVINTTKEEYVLQIGASSRAADTLLSTLPNIDFTKPVMLVHFIGTNERTKKKQPVFLLSQSLNPETGKPVWLKAKYEQKWLSKLLISKVKEGVELTDEDKRNLAFDATGRILGRDSYPFYITEKSDGSWSFEARSEQLHELAKEAIIPAIKMAADERKQAMGLIPGASEPEFAGPSEFAEAVHSASEPRAVFDDDIPF